MDKKEILEQQIAKLTEVIDALEKNFPKMSSSMKSASFQL